MRLRSFLAALLLATIGVASVHASPGSFIAALLGNRSLPHIIQSCSSPGANAGATSVSVTCTVSAGSYLESFVTGSCIVADVTSVTDGTDVYAKGSGGYDTVDDQSLTEFNTGPVVAGTYTITAHYSISCTNNGIEVNEIAGTSGLLASLSANYQAAPATTPGAVTTGLSGTLSSQPALLTGMTITSSGPASITAAGGSSIYTTGWSTIEANFFSLESQALSATTSVAATFTSANGNAQVSVGGVWGAGSGGGGGGSAFYVATTGSDSNVGSLAAPFLTLGKARTAMRASSGSVLTTFVRAGTYSMSSGLVLTSADAGETWSYYPPDGVNTAVLDGGNTLTGGVIQPNGNNITINGLKIQNFVDYGIYGGLTTTGPNTASGLTITNCDVGFNTNTSFQSGGITVEAMQGSTISHNYVHDTGSMGIAVYAYYSGQSINGTTITGNVVLNAVQRMSDGGGIYTNMHGTGASGGSVSITNNYVANYGSAATNSVHAIYTDDTSSNVTVSGNIAGAPTVGVGTSGGFSGITSFIVSSGKTNHVTGNIVDLGTSSRVGTVLWYFNSGEPVDPGMTGNTYTGNIVISKFAGALNSTFAGRTVAYNQYTTDPAGFSYTINSNTYWNYTSPNTNVYTTGNNNNDTSPQNVNPQISGVGYTVAGGSPVFSAPTSFPGIIGNWGPPGFTITNTNRSSP